MSLGPWQLIIIALVILVFFGRGRISDMMGDFGKGIKSFKHGLNEESDTDAKAGPKIDGRISGPSHEAKPASEAARDPKPAESAERRD